MLVALLSVKGSPGVTSTALALAATWPRPVVVLEADPAGGDLAYRCRPTPMEGRGVVQLAAAVRGGAADAGKAVTAQTQSLACGVDLVQGVSTRAQARGIGGLWPAIAEACCAAGVDVIADLGRTDRSSSVLSLAQAADWVMPVAAATVASVQHLRYGLGEVAVAAADSGRALRMRPLLIGPDAAGERNCLDLDVLVRESVPAESSLPVPFDERALARLEDGEPPTGRLGRTLLMRGARQIANQIVEPRHEVVARR